MRRLIWFATLILLFSLAPRAHAGFASSLDNTFRAGWSLLSEEKFADAREAFGEIAPGEYDLGDYVIYFTGVALAREGKPENAESALERLASAFPRSPLIPYLEHEIAFAAAKAGDMRSARKHFRSSRDKIAGAGRTAAGRYLGALLMEGPGGEEGEEGEEGEKSVPRKAAEAHLDNFESFSVQEGALLSMERLWEWYREGKLSDWDLPVSFYGRFAQALFRAGEDGRAREVFRDAAETFHPSDDYYSFLLGYAEFLRKKGEASGARSLLARAAKDAPVPFRSKVDFLFARVEWMAGRTGEARRRFLEIAESDAPRDTAERARYQAAWISEEERDWEEAAEQFRKLSGAMDGQIRRESVFRHAFAVYRQMRYAEAIAAFEAGERSADAPVERGRHAYWRARALSESGEGRKGDELLRILAADPDAGPYALFSGMRLGRDPFEMLNAPSSGETAHCAGDRERLWESIRAADWSKEDAEGVRRAERLARLGLVEYAILEAERVDRAAVRKATGLDDGGTPGLFRYLAGDLRGAIRETVGASGGRAAGGLVERLQYPLAPEYLGDCDGKKSGVDSLVLHAIIRQESLFQYDALSPAGAVGLMQLMPRTATEVARREKIGKTVRRYDLLKPELNVTLGAAYFAQLLRSYDGDYLRAVAAYNAGEKAVGRWWKRANADPAMFLETVSYRETRGYLRRVFFNLLQYYRIFRPGMFARYFPRDRTEDGTAPGALASPPAARSHDGLGEDLLPGEESGEAGEHDG